jgi:murein DD-endopeptidase MepM/ murein hydrolase activator NlpD
MRTRLKEFFGMIQKLGLPNLASAHRLSIACAVILATLTGLSTLFVLGLNSERSETANVDLPLSMALKSTLDWETKPVYTRLGLVPSVLNRNMVAVPQDSPKSIQATRAIAGRLGPAVPGASMLGVAAGDDIVRISQSVEAVSAVLKPGDTLMRLLMKNGARVRDANKVIRAMKPVKNPRRLRAGQPVHMLFLTTDGEPGSELIGLRMKTAIDEEVSVRREKDGAYRAEKIIEELEKQTFRARGRIQASLFQSAGELGVPDRVTVNLAHVLSYSVDFQSEIQEGDEFEILYSQYVDDSGQPVKPGDILFASMTFKGKKRDIYRYEGTSDGVDYFNEDGKSIRKFLMRTPVDAARISSRFGRRFHPIRKRWKAHNGVDFAASRGTRIYAAGGGKVTFVGRSGGYGKLVKIRHSNGYETRYAHMSRYAKGIKKGQRVSQGQVIGYVGSTGWATGSHLHYEVRARGRAVNPLSVKVPTGRTLKGSELAKFQAHIKDVKAVRLATAPSTGPAQTAMASFGD